MATVPEAIAALEAQVTATEGTDSSAEVLIGEFAKFVLANTLNPQVLTDFANRLLARQTALGAAVAANPDPDPAN